MCRMLRGVEIKMLTKSGWPSSVITKLGSFLVTKPSRFKVGPVLSLSAHRITCYTGQGRVIYFEYSFD